MTRQKSAKILRIAVVLFSILVIYVGSSFLWHSKIKSLLRDPSDPFSEPPPDYLRLPDAQRKSILSLGSRAFFDFQMWYHKVTDPMRPRKDPDGKPYFENYQSTWYTPHLFALDRKSLYERDEADTATYYRFTIIPSFRNCPAQSHELKVSSDGTISLHSVRTKSAVYPDIAKKVETPTEKSLNIEELSVLLGGSDTENFWEPLSDLESGMLSGLDGSQWLFEKSTPTSYHLVDFWTPLALTLADGSEDPKMTQFIDKENIRSPVPYAQLGIRFMLEAGFASEEDFTVIEPDPNADPTDPFADP